MIAPYFPPRKRVGSLRPFRFARHLRDFDYEPAVVFIEDKKSRLSEREEESLRGIALIPVKTPFDNTANSGSSVQRSSSPKKSGKSDSLIDRITPMDTWWPLFRLRKKKILKQVKAFNPDLIWSTADPWSSHWLAEKISKKLNLPWISDYRDPWTLCNIRGANKPEWTKSYEKKYEKRFIRNADRIIFTAEATSEKYRSEYQNHAEKIRTIYNSFDEDYFTGETSVKRDQNPDLLYLYFFGKFRQLSPVKPVIDILKALRELDDQILSKIRIVTNEPLTDVQRSGVEKAGLLENFEIEKPVLYEESRAYLQQADVLLLTTSAKRDDIIPAKLWDYMAAGRPVLAVSSNAEVHRLVKHTPEGSSFYPDQATEAAKKMAELWKAKQSGKVGDQEDYTPRAQFGSRETTRQLAAIFDEVTGASNG